MTWMLWRLWRPAPPPRLRAPAQLLALADRRRREGRLADAARLVRAGLAADPHNLTGHLLAAYLHLAARTIEPARVEFAWVLARDPTHPRALLGLARVALEEGDVDACRQSLSRALRLYPDFPEAQALLGALAARRPTPATAPRGAATPLASLRLPPLARALLALGREGAVIVARPESLGDHAERVTRATSLAAAALASARLGSPRRAVVELAEDSCFVRISGEMTLALALPRTTQITPGLLEVNRLWAAAIHDLTVRAEPGPPTGARRVS